MNCFRSVTLCLCGCFLSLDPRAAALHDVLDFLEGDHRRVAPRRLRERAMRRAVLDRFLRRFSREQPENYAACESVAAAHAVLDLEVFVFAALVELPLAPEDRVPVIDEAAHDLAERRPDAFDGGIPLHDLLHHSLVALDLEALEVLLYALDLHAEDLDEVLLVSDQDFYIGEELLGRRVRLLRAPELRTEVEVVARHAPRLVRRLERLERNFRARGRERREDAARVEPADAFGEDPFQ